VAAGGAGGAEHRRRTGVEAKDGRGYNSEAAQDCWVGKIIASGILKTR